MRIAMWGIAALVAASGANGATQDWNAVLSQEFSRLQIVGVQKTATPVAPDRRMTLLLVAARQHWDELSPATQALVRPWMLRPSDSDGDTVAGSQIKYQNPEATPIDSDHFRVHYINSDAYPTDPNAATTTFATQVSAVMEEVWSAQHTTLGYAGVPADTSASPNGGDFRYDVYLAELGSLHMYGYVTSDSVGTPEAATRPNGTYSYMVIDNDYDGFPYADPLEPLKVTAAHEYFHSVQFGYDYREDAAFMEQSSTWMEDMVYPAIHDNYQYIGEPFTDSNRNGQYDTGEVYTDRNGNRQRDEGSTEYPEVHLDGFDVIPNIQYGRFLWPRYLSMKHGNTVMKLAWENCGATARDNAFEAVADALASTSGVPLKSAYQEYAVWGYDTSKFADGSNDGADYPVAWVDGTSTTTANFSSSTTPSLTAMAGAAYPVQMHLSTVYEQIVSPSGAYDFISTGGDPAVTMVVHGADGAVTYQEVAINSGTGTWTAPAGATRAVAVISNASPTADGMAWTFCSGACDLSSTSGGSTTDGSTTDGTASSEDGGAAALDWSVLAIGLGAFARRRMRARP